MNVNFQSLNSPRPRILSIFRTPTDIKDLAEKVERPIEHEFAQFNVSRHNHVIMHAAMGHGSNPGPPGAMSMTVSGSTSITIRSCRIKSATNRNPQREGGQSIQILSNATSNCIK